MEVGDGGIVDLLYEVPATDFSRVQLNGIYRVAGPVSDMRYQQFPAGNELFSFRIGENPGSPVLFLLDGSSGRGRGFAELKINQPSHLDVFGKYRGPSIGWIASYVGTGPEGIIGDLNLLYDHLAALTAPADTIARRVQVPERSLRVPRPFS